MTDMNAYENRILYARHIPTNTWHFATLSGMPGRREPDVYRIDPEEDQDLEDFELWVCRMRFGELIPDSKIAGVTAIYS